ncbi:MAG TPA: sugar phosphate nucleotidyltransferase [Anaerolineales bacterium]|nr:sugar phosphate nucleotidyltransferase [Anaerolineales bacterium]
MPHTFKIVLPMAGRGARLRPHTWSRPKQLLTVAGRPMIDHVLDRLDSLPSTIPREFVFITGPGGDSLERYLRDSVPDRKAHFVYQSDPYGQSHALYMAREHLEGPLLMVFPDTLIETDLGFLGRSLDEAVVWVREVPDPEHFGIAQTDRSGRVRRVVEKPLTREHRQAVVGYYYFPDGGDLADAIEEQLVNDYRPNGVSEFYLAVAVNLLLARGLVMRSRPVSIWHDGGTVHGLLETNAYLLANGRANFSGPAESDGTRIVPPVFLDPSASVEGSLIGPNVSIGAGCRIVNSVIENSIVEAGAAITACRLEASLIGERAALSGLTGIISAGDDSFYSSDL